MTYKYKLRYEYDSNQGSHQSYESDHPVKPGDVIYVDEDGFYYEVIQVLQLQTRVQLLLSKSAQSEQEARLVAEQLRQSR
jgi:hypothetical protein